MNEATLRREGLQACAAVLASLTIAAWTAAPSRGAEQPRADPLADAIAYAKLISEYEHGDDDRAIEEIIAWKPEVVRAVIDRVENARRAGSRATVEVRAVLNAFPVAVMLHTEAGLYLNWRGDPEGASFQWGHAWRLAELHPLVDEQRAFLRAWYHAFGSVLLGSAISGAFTVLERGRQRFPDDVPIELALAQAHEARGTLSAGARHELRTAEGMCRDLLARDSGLAEARLRLGRMLQITGRPELALPELKRVASTSDDARLRYLAHLFAGDLLRRQSRFPDARQEFTEALGAWPGGQAAALSLAEVLHSLGERASAASTLEAAIASREQPLRPDPFRSYHVGDRAEQRRLLEAVKATVRRPG